MSINNLGLPGINSSKNTSVTSSKSNLLRFSSISCEDVQKAFSNLNFDIPTDDKAPISFTFSRELTQGENSCKSDSLRIGDHPVKTLQKIEASQLTKERTTPSGDTSPKRLVKTPSCENIQKILGDLRIVQAPTPESRKLVSTRINEEMLDHKMPKGLSPSLDFDDIQSSNRTSHVSFNSIDGSKIAEALQEEAVFTNATDKKPIVATWGCGPCIALGGYEPINKIAFVVHFSTAEGAKKSRHLIFANIAKLVKEKITAPIQLHLRGGFEGKSEGIIEAIKEWTTQEQEFPMEIASENVLKNKCLSTQSLSIDSRNGEVSDYDPSSNSKSRELTDLDATRAISNACSSQVRIAYHPMHPFGQSIYTNFM